MRVMSNLAKVGRLNIDSCVVYISDVVDGEDINHSRNLRAIV